LVGVNVDVGLGLAIVINADLGFNFVEYLADLEQRDYDIFADFDGKRKIA